MKKTLCILLSGLLILASVAFPVFADSVGYSAAAVTSADLSEVADIKTLTSDNYAATSEWKITDAAGLKKLSVTCNTNELYNFAGKTIYLANDIDMSGVTDFAPIAYNSAFTTAFVTAFNGGIRFTGTFDGQGHTIRNLVMSSTAADCTSVALFGAVRGGCIRNLIIDRSCSFTYTGTSNKVSVASVVGLMFASGSDGKKDDWADSDAMEVTVMVENVQSSAVVTLNNQDGYKGYVGGLVGYIGAATGYFAVIRNSSFLGVVAGSGTGAAGIYACWMEGGRNMLCKNNLMQGKLAAKGTYVHDIYGQGAPTKNINNQVEQPFAANGYSAEAVSSVDLSSVADINTLAAQNDQGFDVAAYTAGSAWKITDAAGLQLLSKISNAGKDYGFAGKTVYFAKDIDCLGVSWKPIADSGADPSANPENAVCFRGTLDGQGHSLKNLAVSSSASGNAAAAFIGSGCGFTIRNLVVEGSCSFSYAGSSSTARAALVGAVWADDSHVFAIENASVAASVSAQEGYAAALIGSVAGSGTVASHVSHVTVTGVVSGKAAAAAAIANATGGEVDLTDVICYSDVTATNTGAGIAVSTGAVLRASACQMVGTVAANVPSAILSGTTVAVDDACCPAFATLRVTDLEPYYGYRTAAVDYEETVGYDASRIVAKDLTDVLPICTFLDAPLDVVEYKISTPADLIYLAEMVNASADFRGYTIYLENDINMAGKTMAPIGSPISGSFSNINTVNYFGGVFDGQGHVIDNLVMTSDVSVDSQTAVVGLFGVLKSATIRNLVLGSGCSFSYTGTGAGYAGGIAGIAYRLAKADTGYETVIDNCYSLASVSGTRSAAGIVGSVQSNTNNDPCTVKNCTNAGPVTSKEYGAGIVAYLYNRPMQVLNCRNTGTITLDQAAAANNRGIAGIFARPSSNQTVIIRNCVNNGTLAGPGTMGGVVAIESSDSVRIDRCTNYGALNCTTDNKDVGPMYGLYSLLEYDQMTSNCDATGKTDESLSSVPAVVTAFPDYAAIDAAHDLLFRQDTDDETEPATTEAPKPSTTAPVTEETPSTVTTGTGESNTAAASAETSQASKGCASTAGAGLLAMLLCVGLAGWSVRPKKEQ